MHEGGASDDPASRGGRMRSPAKGAEGAGPRNAERALAESLEQQAATSEILRVIAQSRGDAQPVFDTIARSAARICQAAFCHVFRFEGGLLHFASSHGLPPEHLALVHSLYPMPPGRGSAAARAVRSGRVEEIPDIEADAEYAHGAFSKAVRQRSIVAVPMLLDGSPIGAIAVARSEAGSFSERQLELLKTFADQAVIAVENATLFREIEGRNRALLESLEHQTATAEILRVISRTPDDVQPVFDVIGERAGRLCDARVCVVSRVDGDLIQQVAIGGVSPEGRAMVERQFPMTRDTQSATARAVRKRSVEHIVDVFADADYGTKEAALAADWRSCVAVPMLRGDDVIGAIFVAREVAGPFPDSKIELLKTFADQAVIAVENVRLFNETKEALERQTATGDVLKVISRSAFDLGPVLDTVLESATRLCGAQHGHVMRFDGKLLRLAASHGGDAAMMEWIRAHPLEIGRGSIAGVAAAERRPVHWRDVLEIEDYRQGGAQRHGGFRTILGVPMLKGDALLGVIVLWKTRVEPFTDKQVQLVATFADQAVIAIENVRLFNETKEALEHQTATAEILRVISSSPTDTKPVFDIIAERAAKLCEAECAVVSRFDGKVLQLAAISGVSASAMEAIRSHYPLPLDDGTLTSRATLERSVIHVPDVQQDARYAMKEASIGQWRGGLAVPMRRGDEDVGAIFVGRLDPGYFPDAKVALLQTFADQAVIAIENVRLFNETKEALEQQTATSEVLKVISRSALELDTVLGTVMESAARLCGAQHCHIYRYDGELLRLAASFGADAGMVDFLRTHPLRLEHGSISGTAGLERRPVHWPDVLEVEGYRRGEAQRLGGYRTLLAVPMLKSDTLLGVMVLWKVRVDPFTDKQIELVTTFADQAVIAIENVRLFNELKERTSELDQSVGELRALGEVGQAVASTLDLDTVLQTIVSRASALTGTQGGSIWEFEEARQLFHLHATHNLPDEVAAALRDTPIRRGEGVVGRLAVHPEPVVVRDIVDESSYQSRVREVLVRHGYRSILAVPLLHDRRLLGGLVINRDTPGDFAPQVVELLKSFAAQSALAIQNARLFRELEHKGRELESASRHKSEFLANMSHELRTPLNAILGFSELLSERIFGEINDKQAEYLTDIQESGRHLLALINDILDLSKIEAGRMELEVTDFDLPTAIENTLILLRERAERRGIALRREIDPSLGAFRADERKLKQVLLNLLSNALKFTPEGGRIDVVARAQRDGVRISVADTGVGIAPEDQSAVFEEFRQVGSAAKKVEGTGLGLAISRKFVELHGGRIGVTSEPGKGATFAFTLPMQSPAS
jgi:GAF domain-containing protein